MTSLVQRLTVATLCAGIALPAFGLPVDPPEQTPPPAAVQQSPTPPAPKPPAMLPSAPQGPAHSAAPPVTQPPPGQLPCNWSGDSGGQGVTRHKHYLGDKPGFVTLNYNMFVKPDNIQVFYRGQQIAGSGGARSGRGGFGFDWKPVPPDYSVEVVVTGEMNGTQWNYTFSCPK